MASLFLKTLAFAETLISTFAGAVALTSVPCSHLLVSVLLSQSFPALSWPSLVPSQPAQASALSLFVCSCFALQPSTLRLTWSISLRVSVCLVQAALFFLRALSWHLLTLSCGCLVPIPSYCMTFTCQWIWLETLQHSLCSSPAHGCSLSSLQSALPLLCSLV